MNWQEHNRTTSLFCRKRDFLQRQIARYQYSTPRDMATRSRHERMAQRYREELARLEAR